MKCCGLYTCLILILLVLGGVKGEVENATPFPGSNVTSHSGPYTIIYSPSDLPMLQVTEQDRLVWFTSRSRAPFLVAAKVTVEVVQVGGAYTFKHHTTDTCRQLEITEVEVRKSSPGGFNIFFMRGVLCGSVAMEMSLQATELSANGGKDVYHHLTFNLSMVENARYNQLHLVYGCDADEGFYGFGAQYSRLNMKGKVLPMFLSEQGVGRGLQPVTEILDSLSPGSGGDWWTTYTRVPHYITSAARSLYLESLEYAEFDLTQDDTVTLRMDSNEIAGRIISGSTPLEVISSYTALVGRLSPLPEWVGQGAVLGLQGGSASVLRTLDSVERDWGNLSDVVGVWLQDWTGQRNISGTHDLPRVGLWWNWEVDRTHYPDWTQLISTLRSKGIRTLTYISPLFADVSKRGTPFQHNYYEEGLEKGFFVKTSNGEVWSGYSNSSLLDITNPLAYEWMLDIITENMLDTGVCGWMCDFGESLPLDAVLLGNHTAPQLHSLYPSLWGQLNAKAIQRVRQGKGAWPSPPDNQSGWEQLDAAAISSVRGKWAGPCVDDEVVYFMRSGNAQSPAHTRLFWVGDQMVTWDAYDGLATVVMAMLSQGLSGYSLSHSDIGGYTALMGLKPGGGEEEQLLSYFRSKELFLRWCELAAFSCMYRTHLGTLPTHNWQFNSDPDTLQHFFKMAVVFQSWGFYRTQLMGEAEEHGWPVIRHMMLVFPDNPSVYEEALDQQFMVGASLLVAPVMAEGVKEVDVFLPVNTTWASLWGNSDVVFEGANKYVKFPAPLGRPCVLYSTATDVGPKFVANLKKRKLL